ncbi:tryptophan halogenase family protein [Caulobacter sp. 17J80-11]|uniref:tryptophan halogenase family protein n=1 Tax=Caulobacter sp. 17J80-11 TaxID=2763502 RepID=UPI0016538F4E|nr:tryptophan halogenase family protein [Caulobacter sp. 17J80-11]MBC6983415.1 tryptophan 7-halogenase [Caulobacter sp. 17J80-11]
MSRPLDVVIVGGGTAGWMTAAALVGVLKPNVCRVRLIESDEIGIVGVGEATLPQMKDFNDLVGIDEAEMMRSTNATFKLGIEFLDWGFKGSTYVHPFGAHGQAWGGVGFHHHWLRAAQNGRPWDIEAFSYAVVASRCDRFEFPSRDPAAIEATYNYAYHFDASLYARYLRGFAEARGLRRTEGKVVEVVLHPESGNVDAIRMESGELVAGDLFIDCSGFRGLIIGQALQSGFEDWSKWLPCDRALAVPCDRAGRFTPFTRSTAREAGWQWRIPLQHRTGNGYVYSSSFISDDDAAATLMRNLDGEAQAEPRPLRFKAGRRVDCWRKNCIAMGLASGFLEPLESTSIYLVQVAITNLLRLFPRNPVDPALVEEFNRLVDNEYDRIRDFLILHYHANTREDGELWRYCRDMEVPDSLRSKIELFTRRGHLPQYKDGLFSPPSWLSVLLGQGLRPQAYDRLADNLPLDELFARMETLHARIDARTAAMPGHDAFVRSYCASAEAVRAPALAGADA